MSNIFEENWTVVPYGDGDSLVIHADDDHRVCFMATPGDSPGAMDEIAKRADLIAAAPRMYRALAEIARLRTELSGDFSRASYQSDIAREAIAPLRTLQGKGQSDV